MMNNLFQKNSKIINGLYLICLVLYYGTLLFVNDIKSLLFVTLSLLLMIIVILKTNLLESLFLLCLNLVWLEKSLRGTNLIVVPQGFEPWMSDYSIYFGLSIKLILVTCMLIIIVFEKAKTTQNKTDMLMILMLLLGSISVLLAPDFLLAFSGVVRIYSAVGLYFISLFILRSKSLKSYVVISLMAVFAFQAAVGTYQLLSSNQLSIYLNDAFGLRRTGYFTSDGPSIFRATGLVSHPTHFGALMTILLPFVCWKLLDSFKKYRATRTIDQFVVAMLLLLVFIMGGLAIYGSFSRSAWIISMLIIVTFFLLKIKEQSKKIKQKLGLFFVSSLLLLTTLLPNFQERIATIPNFITTGSGKVRMLLIQESFFMILQHPLFGVGPNHFVRAMDQRDLVPELRGFMFPVHNTFLLFASEMGIPMVTVFIIIISISLMKLKSSQNPKNNFERITIYTAIVSFVISSQFHALYNQDPTFELLFIFLAWSQSL